MAKKLTGTVVANMNDKTATVAVDKVKIHRIYHKRYNVTRKYLVHDEENSAAVGDTVRIVETRPLSKRKRWRIDETLEKGLGV